MDELNNIPLEEEETVTEDIPEVEELPEEPPVEDVTEDEPAVEEPPIEEGTERVNPFCVISKNTYGEGEVVFHDIQTNNAWSANPYGEDYAVVPDELVPEIMETRGFCDIELSEDGTEVVGFTAREIPQLGPTEEELEIRAEIEELKAQLAASDYKAIKYAEGWISAEEYAPTLVKRQELRDRINELEAQLPAQGT